MNSTTTSTFFKKTFLLLIFLGFSLNLFAQNIISGKVTDQKGQPLIGANIILKNTYIGTTTGIDGSYKINDLPSGNYTVLASYIGYQTFSEDINLQANTELDITLKEGIRLAELTILSYRDYPVTLTEVDQKEIESRNLGQDLPILLQYTPSVVSTSDAGAGVGYTGMRIRGSDASRTNVTVNGIPLNDAESQGVFWVNMPDFASSTSSIQIQRGVGTSVNGAGAFGATVNITTLNPADEAKAEINNSFGSFNTFRHNLELHTGYLNEGQNVKIFGRLSKITSDGFIDEAFADLRSFYLSGVYENKVGTNIQLNIFSGQEQTFQAWNGVPEQVLEEGNRTFNELAGYDNETDNYQQDHYQFIFDQQINEQLTANVALHYTYGRGYFEQFRQNDDLSLYGLENVLLADSTLIETADVIRRRWLDNDFYGTVFNLNYESKATKANREVWSATFGGGYNIYEGKHFGEVIWAEYAPNSSIRDRYYDNDATKTDFNLFGKLNYQLFPNLFAFADMQIRTVNYDFVGFDNNLNNVEQTAELNFFNPKYGLSYTTGKHDLYISWARAHREPNRDDFTESTPSTRPEAERLDNFEFGWQGRFKNLSFSANYYLMYYTDQLILTGQVNDVGAYTRQNVEDSYRTGIELVADWSPTSKINWNANATFSQNRIQNFTEFIDDFDNGGQIAINYGDTDIAFSPAIILGSQFSYLPSKGFAINFLSRYVGEQFLDNTSTDSRKIDAYFVNDLQLRYNFSYKFLKNVEFNLLINNIFDEEYESNGYTFGFVSSGETIRQNYFYPQAGTNFLLGLKVGI